MAKTKPQPWNVWSKDPSRDAWMVVDPKLSEQEAREGADRRIQTALRSGIAAEFMALPHGTTPHGFHPPDTEVTRTESFRMPASPKAGVSRLPDLSQREELHRLLDVAMDYQDRKYGPFTDDVVTVRAAIGFLQDEAEEARQAWHEDSRPGSEPWARTAEEVMQVAGVAMRLMIAMGVGLPPVQKRARRHDG